jgi:hypothetical protein
MTCIARPLIVLLTALLLCSRASAGATTPFDRWYVLLLQDQRAGWVHMTVSEKDGLIHSDSDMHIKVRRGAAQIAMRMQSSFVETAEGKPVEASVTQSLGASQAMQQNMRFLPEGIEVTSTQAGRTQTQLHPNPDVAWLTPAAASRFAEAQLAAGAKAFRFHTLDPSMGPQAVETSFTVEGEHVVEVMGKMVPALLVHSTVSVLPGVVTQQYVDAGFQPVKMTVALMPGMELTMLEADELLAKAQLDAPEMLVQTLVRPDKPINQPRALRRAVYEVQTKDQDIELPTLGVQRVAPGSTPGTVTVTVDLDAPIPSRPEDAPGDEHRRATPMLDSDDVRVRQLTLQALRDMGPDAPPAEKAEALRQFALRYVKAKDLSVGFATASEVARTRQGDCTEHAVLLAAMLRAAEIPSRTVTGLIYIDEFVGQRGVFAYHMWTQAWLAVGAGEEPGLERWVDLDATLPGQPFDAAHITLAVSAMADPAPVNDLVRVMPLLGRIKLKVVEP